MINCMYSTVRAIIYNTHTQHCLAIREGSERERKHTAHDRIGCCRVRSTSVIWDKRVMEISSAGLLVHAAVWYFHLLIFIISYDTSQYNRKTF
jgi:hypothetical protein